MEMSINESAILGLIAESDGELLGSESLLKRLRSEPLAVAKVLLGQEDPVNDDVRRVADEFRARSRR